MIERERDRSRTAAPATAELDDPLASLAEERATYRRHLPALVGEHDGRFVLIRGQDVIGVFDDRPTALREGYRRFGTASFLVRQVAAAEPIVYLPNVSP